MATMAAAPQKVTTGAHHPLSTPQNHRESEAGTQMSFWYFDSAQISRGYPLLVELDQFSKSVVELQRSLDSPKNFALRIMNSSIL